MARRPPAAEAPPAAGSARETAVTVTMTVTEALALARIADTGLRVTEALALVQSTASAERGLKALTEAATRPRKG